MGRSDRRPDGYKLNLFAQEASDALDAAGMFDSPTQPIVIGHSMGGMCGIAAAARDSRIRALIVVDTPINMDRSRWEDAVARAPKPRPEPHLFDSLEQGLARFRMSPPQDTANHYIADHIARLALVEHQGKWTWHFDPRRISVDPADNVVQSRDLQCPVAFIYGERSAIFPGDTLARTLASLPPGTPSIGIPDAAHHVLIDQPLALVSALRAVMACWGN